jgi:hypothetical protein
LTPFIPYVFTGAVLNGEGNGRESVDQRLAGRTVLGGTGEQSLNVAAAMGERTADLLERDDIAHAEFLGAS